MVPFVRRLCAKLDRVRYGIDIYRSTADRVNNNKGINHGAAREDDVRPDGQWRTLPYWV